jgi:hypothetical protein
MLLERLNLLFRVNNMEIKICPALFGLLLAFPVVGNVYKVPPTSTTRGHVPVMSDAQSKQCVKLYNEAQWLYEELGREVVDQYSKASVDNYNRKVNEHTAMTNNFNRDCAGKQSLSACKKAQELNKEKGLPYQQCVVGK